MGERRTRVTSSHSGAFEVTTEGDRIVSTAPFADDPGPNDIHTAVPAAVHHRKRVARPSIREGWLNGGYRAREIRGEDTFVELPWDEALDIAAAEIDRVRKQHGNAAIFGGSYGWSSAGRFHHAQGQLHRFLNVTGGYVSSFGSYSTGTAQAIIPHVLGWKFLELMRYAQNRWPMIDEYTENLVMFGGINPKNSMVSMSGNTLHETSGWLKRFIDQGKRLVTVSPQRTDGPDGAEWLPVIPGTDTALMLALAYVLEAEGLADQDFLARCSVGYERFRPYLTGETDGQPKSPKWAAPICGISADAVRELARSMAAKRTLITVSWSLQRAQHGEQPFWMAVVLAAMLGQIGLPGGGIGFGYGAIGAIGVAIRDLTGMTLPQGENPVKDFIPVARIAEMLKHPGGEYEYNGRRKNYPDIRLVYWCGGNPFHHHQDLGDLHQAWKRPETIIVNENFWTATAKRADIVFPATTPYEREDIGRAFNDPYLYNMPQLVPPQNEARNDYDIFAGLAARMGLEEAFTEGRSTEEWLRHLYSQFRQRAAAEGVETPDFDELRDKNFVRLPIVGAEHVSVPFSEFRSDPDSAALNTPSGRIEIFSETIAGFGYDDCPGHPTWLPPDEYLGAPLSLEYPLHLVSPQPGDKLHSQLEAALMDREGSRPERAVFNPVDAASRGIADGDLVALFNARGRCIARAVVSEDIREGVVALPTGSWYDPDAKGADQFGNPNALTRDKGTSRLGQGTSAHTTLIQAELAR